MATHATTLFPRANTVLRAVALVAFVGLCALALIHVVPTSSATVAIQVLDDGSYAMSSAPRTRMSPQVIADQLDNMPELPGRVVIDVAENRILSDLMPLLVKLCEKGFGWYSIRVGGTLLNFHVPGCGMEEHYEEPNVVDLRVDPSEPFESGGATRPILVLVDDSMNCKKMLDRLRDNGLIHESIEIRGDDLELLRSPQEDLPRKNYRNRRLPPSFLQRLLDVFREARTPFSMQERISPLMPNKSCLLTGHKPFNFPPSSIQSRP